MALGIGLMLLGGSPGCGEAPATGQAQASPDAEVVPVRALPEVRNSTLQRTRVAPHGKARVTPLSEGKGAFVAWLDLEAGATVPAHRDETEESLVVIHGGGTLVMEGQTYPLTAGDSVLMPAGVEVSYTNGPEPTRVLQVFAGPAPAAKYANWTFEPSGG